MAAELKLVEPTQKVTLIQSRDKLLSSEPLPGEFKDRTVLVLEEQGVEVILGHRVLKQEQVELNDGNTHFKLTMSDGSEIMADHVIWAISKSVPSTTFLPATTLNDEGNVKINSKYCPNSSIHQSRADFQSQAQLSRHCPIFISPLRSRRLSGMVRHQTLRRSHGNGPHRRREHPPTASPGPNRQRTTMGRVPRGAADDCAGGGEASCAVWTGDWHDVGRGGYEDDVW